MNQIERTSALALLCLAGVGAGVGAAQAPLVSVSVQPVQPLIEQGKQQQLLNFDFRVDNMSTDKIELSGIEVSVLGAGGTLLAQYRLGTNGMSILTVPQRDIEAGKSLIVFNPLYAFPQELDVKHLRFDFQFDAGDQEAKYKAQADVHPLTFTPKVPLSLPVGGPVLVHDGHDFYGHHRRLNLQDGMAQALKWQRNFMRYSYDFVVTDGQGHMFKNDGAKNEFPGPFALRLEERSRLQRRWLAFSVQ